MLLQISLSVRPHGINQYSFLVYLLGLHNRFTVTFGTSLLCVNLSAYYAFVPSFCPSGYDFAIPSSRLHLTMQTLGVAFGLVGNYLPADFHRRALICPSYAKKPHGRMAVRLFRLQNAMAGSRCLSLPAYFGRRTPGRCPYAFFAAVKSRSAFGQWYDRNEVHVRASGKATKRRKRDRIRRKIEFNQVFRY